LDLFEKAKKARDQAAVTAGELATQAGGTASRFRESAAGVTRDLRESVAGVAGDLRDAGTTRLRETVAEFTATLPVLGEMGYTLVDLSITLGVPPSLHATFDVSHDVTDDEVAHILERNAERALTTLLVRSLVHARRLQQSVAIAGMKPRGIGVDIGLSPHVSIRFSR
jgi:hypothetical protein